MLTEESVSFVVKMLVNRQLLEWVPARFAMLAACG